MTEEKDIKDNKKANEPKKTLSLKTNINPTQIRSNFSSNRANTVVVEQKRKRVIRNPEKTNAFDKKEGDELTNREINARNQAIIDSKNSNLDVPKTYGEDTTNTTKGERGKVKEKNDTANQNILDNANIPIPQEMDGGKKNKRNTDLVVEQEPGLLDEEVEEAKAPNKFTRFRPQEERRQTKITVTTALDDSPRQRSLASIRRRREREKKATHNAYANTKNKQGNYNPRSNNNTGTCK